MLSFFFLFNRSIFLQSVPRDKQKRNRNRNRKAKQDHKMRDFYMIDNWTVINQILVDISPQTCAF